ncbi:MAG: efflux RND transporter periplasmic adaptor subunit [Salinivirgaceae bacterium]|nr:efflux RND transporter periplasmic adaptor subunit [Salinivirgaceae bacterium]MDD4747758.1 efflux RND transporter periplasmic adaptor subunit [Salinivirgaceae bacterium]MDY0280884.1 efflux RND transporter periplasmic adaptor subunit [Salinivirgaceae bacterium]
MKQTLLFPLFVILTLFAGCSSEQNSTDNNIEQTELLTITQKQFETDKMEFGQIETKPFSETIKCSGTIVAKPAGVAKVSSPISGVVIKIYGSLNQDVKQNQILFELGGNELIELQKEYADAASHIKQLKSEYDRIKALYEENIGTEKEVIAAKSEYNKANATYEALKLKIGFLGLDPLKIEEASFVQSVNIKSPINGFITQISVAVGQYIELQTSMVEIIDQSQLQLQVAVFEKDIHTLKTGHSVLFNTLNAPEKSYDAVLKSVGRNLDVETHTILCFGDIKNLSDTHFINNEFVEVGITTHSEMKSAVPESAIIKTDENYYLLAFNKMDGNNYLLNKIKIEVGRVENGYVEILNEIEDLKIISSGVYNMVLE